MEFKDYYQTLGVSRDATQDEIKRAYRKLARKYHPDVSKEPEAATRFKEVGEAYEVLKDPEKRAAYDQLGPDWQQGQDFQPPPNWEPGFAFSGGGYTSGGYAGGQADTFSACFASLVGRARRGGAGAGPAGGPAGTRGFQMAGEDRHAQILIDLDDAFHGATRTITLRAPQVDAQGRVVQAERTLTVKIPRGVRAGQHIRLAGQGEPGVGEGKAGDLYLEIEFRPHPLYRADGRDLFVDLPVAPWEAALGATVPVPTPGGPVELKVPPNIGAGRKLRLKGRGIPGNPPGDLFAVVQIKLPPADSESARAAWRNTAEQFKSFNPRANLGV